MTLNKLKIIIVPFLFLLLISLSTSTITSATTTLEVVENDLVKLVPTAIDPDGDKITFYYESPFNENGEWQTTLDDEGTYLTKIIASDGVSQNEEEVTLLVKNKNQPPQIKNNKLTVYEQETVDLKPLASDPDGDELKYIFEEPFDEEGTWTPSYKDE